MKRKKLTTLLIAGALVLVIGVGAYAWFTAKGEARSSIEMHGVEGDNNPDAGVNVEFVTSNGSEEDSEEEGVKLLPGRTINKFITITNTANYDQYLRVKFDIQWKAVDEAVGDDGNVKIVDGYYLDEAGEVVYVTSGERSTLSGNSTSLDNSKIVITFADSSVWEKGQDGYYYYTNADGKIVGVSGELSTIELNVAFNQDTDDNYYKNLTFDILVTAEGVQADEDAIWVGAPDSLKANQE